MCDILTMKCEGCGVEIDTHIGDYSASPGNVHPFCHKPACRKKAMQMLVGAVGAKIVKKGRGKNAKVEFKRVWGGDEDYAQFMVFSSVPYSKKVYKGAQPGKKAVLFLVDMPREISTNG